MEPNLENKQQNDITQPEQTANITEGTPTESSPTESNTPQNTPVKKSNKTGIILGFVFLSLIATGGVGFGVWTMMEKQATEAKFNSQITSLKEQISTLTEKTNKEEDDNKEEGKSEHSNSEDSTSDDIKMSYWPVHTGIVGEYFYVLNENDQVIAKHKPFDYFEIEVCDSPVGPEIIKEIMCMIVNHDHEHIGEYLYNGETGILEFYTAEEWKQKIQQ